MVIKQTKQQRPVCAQTHFAEIRIQTLFLNKKQEVSFIYSQINGYLFVHASDVCERLEGETQSCGA